jgi:CelD/BcsL family acetyltransferase involved in cellulose biosynthesis
MVDAAASLQGLPEGRAAVAASRADHHADTTFIVEDDLAAYADVARRGVFSPAQSPIWIENWIKYVRPDFVVATLARGGQPALSVALEVIRNGPLRTASFMSGRHANGNMPPMTAAFAQNATVADLRALAAAVAKARPDIDLIAFDRLATEIGGTPNALLLLPHRQSPNLSLAVSLEGGFDALLSRASGKRKRKKHRSQTRKFEAAGGFHRIEAKNEVETNALLDAFFAMKEVRFRKAGIANVFAEADVQAFFRAIFAEALKEPTPSFVLNALEVGGIVRAVTGSSRCADRLICEFGAIADDDVAFASPGEFLFFDNIREACQQGYAVYDFSVGDEPYKRLWCNLEIRQFDALVPLTAKGHAAAAGMHIANRAKSFVKNNRLIWNLVKAFRKKAAAAPQAPEED